MKDFDRIRQVWDSLNRCSDDVSKLQRMVRKNYSIFVQATGERHLDRGVSVPLELNVQPAAPISG